MYISTSVDNNDIEDKEKEQREGYRPSPMPAKSPFSQGRSMLNDDLRVMNKDKNVLEKLLYWVIFKTAYHVGFVYYMLKGIILRRW